MRFVEPLYLLLIVPAVLGLVFSFRHVFGMAKGRKRFAFAIRFLLAASLIFALAGPEARRPNEGLCTIFLVDRSASIDDEDRMAQEKFIAQAMERLGPTDQAGVVVFGRSASVDSGASGRRTLGRILTKVDDSATDIEGAIRLASGIFPQGKGKRLVVLSDGNETIGDVEGAAQVASTDQIPIDFVPLGRAQRTAEATVVDLQIPSEARVSQPFELKAIVDSSVEQGAKLLIDRDGVIVDQIQARLSPGKNTIVATQQVSDSGFHRYRATLIPNKDQDARNNIGMGFVSVIGKPRTLIIQGNTSNRALGQAIAKQGIDADVVTPGSIPVQAEDLQRYESVVFNDVGAEFVLPIQMKLIESMVKNTGIGMAMIGGENSFLPGGWYGTPIADALPVDLNVRQRKSFPSTSILIIIDASGSMAMIEDGIPKIRLAAKAAEETVKLMSQVDRVGVAGSTDGIEMVAPMQRLEDKSSVISQIRKLSTGGGGIYIRPSVDKAAEVLSKETTRVRHFILLADGADSEDQDGAIPVALSMRAMKITTSVVAIGDGQDVPFLKKLAFAGGGRFYLAKTANQLPAIFTQDAAIMGRSAIEEGVFLPKVNPSEEILRGIDLNSIPPLYAYCLTDTKPLAKLGMKTAKDDPLLATWQYGLANTLAFTSDAQARWATKWVGWDGFGTFWAQAVRSISRRSALNRYQVSVDLSGGKGKVKVGAFDKFGNPVNSISGEVQLSTPSGATEKIPITQEAPGVFTGSFGANEIGSYIVTVSESGGVGGTRISASGFSIPYPPEYRNYRPNIPLLERIAQVSGGMAISEPAESLRPIVNAGESVTPLWSLFLIAAALILPFDVTVRRLAIPVSAILARVWRRMFAPWRREPEAAPSIELVGRMHQAKQRASSKLVGHERVSVPAGRKEEAPVAVAPTKPGGNVAGKLLDAKRRRQDAD